MNNRRFVVSFFVVFVFIFVYEWVLHGMLLDPIYQKTAELWRPEAEIINYFHWMLVGQFCIAVFFCLLMHRMYQHSGIQEAMGIGLLLGLFLSAPNLIMYAVTPYPITLVIFWVLGGCIELVGAAVLFALIYRRP